MNPIIAQSLKQDIIFMLDNIQFTPDAIIMSEALHTTLEKPSAIKDVNVLVNDSTDKHWKFKD